jgi:glycosyltransferase involved in cell wall biosynthesis
MNVCLVSREYPPETAHGGIGSQTWNKARALAELGHTIHVVSASAGSDRRVRTRRDELGMTVHRIPAVDSETTIYEPATYWLAYSWSVLCQLQRLMQTTTFDVIDFPDYGAEGFAYQLDRTPWNWAPVVVQLHGPLAMLAERIGWPDEESEFYRVGRFMEELSIRRADRLMACSANIADFVAETYGVHRDGIDVVHCGVDAQMFHPADGRIRGERAPTVLFVGNIADNKGIHPVVDAILGLRARYPGIRLRVAGKGDDDTIGAIERRVREAGAHATVEFLGFVEDRTKLPQLYQQADVFCAPSQHEAGVANVFIEAMACGCPVVTSAAGGTPEAVVDEVTGLLLPSLDAASIEAAVDRLLASPTLRRRMGEAGRRVVETRFAMDRYVERVLATYETAVYRSQRNLERMNEEMSTYRISTG